MLGPRQLRRYTLRDRDAASQFPYPSQSRKSSTSQSLISSRPPLTVQSQVSETVFQSIEHSGVSDSETTTEIEDIDMRGTSPELIGVTPH